MDREFIWASDKARYAFVVSLIGLPYERGGKGPESFDSCGLVRHLQRLLMGQHVAAGLPLAPTNRAVADRCVELAAKITMGSIPQGWTRLAEPRDGSIVTMKHPESGSQLGTYLKLDGGVVVYTLATTGVNVDSVIGLKSLGWTDVEFWSVTGR